MSSDDIAEPGIIVCTRADDREVDHLSLAAAARGIMLLRMDADRAVSSDVHYTLDPHVLTVDGRRVRPLLVWERHWSAASLQTDYDHLTNLFIQDQWASLIVNILHHPDVDLVNGYDNRTNLGRAQQLKLAKKLGMAVPNTVVTANPAEARKTLSTSSDSLIRKTLGQHFVEHPPGQLNGLFAGDYVESVEQRKEGRSVEPAPMLYQEKLKAKYELRVFSIYGKTVAYQIDPHDPISLFETPENVRVLAVDTPKEVEDFIHRFLDGMHLNVTAFDFLINQDEVIFFLEVNTACDWRLFELLARDEERVSKIVSDKVCTHAERLA